MLVAPLAVLLAGVALGCGDDAGAVDGGADAAADATPPIDAPGPLSVAVEGPQVAFVGEPACYRAVHRGGEAARVTFIWGDETRDEDAPDEACHVFPYPSHFLVAVVVEAGAERADGSRIVSVVFRPSAPAPSRSSPIALDRARDRVWVTSPDGDTVAVLRADPPALEEELDACLHPRTLAIAGDTVAVACQGDGTLALFDATSLARLRTVALGAGSEPYGVAADPRGGRVWVSRMALGDVVAVDVPSGAIGPSVPLGIDPRGVAMNAEGVLLVTRWRSALDAAHVYHVDASDPAAPVLVADAPLPRQKGLDSDTDNDGVLSFLNQVVFSPDGGRALLPAHKANVVAGLYRTGAMLTTQTTARAVLAEVMVGTSPSSPVADSWRHSFDDLDVASALAFSELGDRAYVAMQGAEVVLEIDPFSFDVTGSIALVGSAPQGLAVDSARARLFAQAFLDRTVRVYDVSDLSREPPLLAEVSTVAVEPLEATVLEGKRIFYRSRDPRMSRTSYLSCATCHLDGEGDNLVWDFTQRGEGLRNTISLRGRAGTAHGPLHWSANFDEVQDFEHDIRSGQGGTGFMSDTDFHTGTRDTTLGDPKAGVSAELDALAAYVSSLSGFGTSPLRRDGDAAWEASFARGAALFSSAGCAGCHAGSPFTDSAFIAPGVPRLHDVGTLGPGSGSRLGGALDGIDTPTLRGLWRTAPYLHDGSAATLRDVLVTRNPTDAHGTTSTLGDADLRDLESYLLSLDDAVP
jgi:DNA-binding beta-propeller fold protein YncE